MPQSISIRATSSGLSPHSHREVVESEAGAAARRASATTSSSGSSSAAGPSSGSGHLGALDVSRGLAAVAVAVFHFTCNGWLPAEHWLTQVGWFGHLGVRSFFVISGFVILLAMWRGGYRTKTFPSFLLRRMVRLFPPYAVSLVIVALMGWMWGSPPTAGALASHLFYLNDFLGIPWLVDAYWTLAIEVQFYFAAALIWPVVTSPRSWPVAILAGLSMALCFAPWPDRSLLNYWQYFLFGIAAFRWYAHVGPRSLNLVITTITAAVIWRVDGLSSLVAAGLPLALLALPMTAPKWGRFLGEISYSVYLFHLVAGASLLTALAPQVQSVDARAALVVVALLLSLAVGWLGYLLIEAPAIRWAKRFRYRAGTSVALREPAQQPLVPLPVLALASK